MGYPTGDVRRQRAHRKRGSAMDRIIEEAMADSDVMMRQPGESDMPYEGLDGDGESTG